MGNVERFGLLALFILCALIVGVGIFGSDRTEVPRFKKATLEAGAKPVPRDEGGARRRDDERRRADWDDGGDPARSTRSRIAHGGEQLRPVRRKDTAPPAPAPHRRSSMRIEPLEFEDPKESDPEPVVAPAMVEYRIKQGDSIWRIAKRELGSPSKANQDAILKANPGLTSKLAQGKTILLPRRGAAPASTRKVAKRPPVKVAPRGMRDYRVRKGDNLWVIAKRELGSATQKNIQAIRDANPSIAKGDRIDKGQLLRLPVASN